MSLTGRYGALSPRLLRSVTPRCKNHTVVSHHVFQVLADAVVIVHLGFVLFVVLGGLLVLRWRRIVWLHVPAAMWGIAVEFADWICPLTPLENGLRERAGMTMYHGDFIEVHVLPLLYPARLTRGMQLLLGSVALAINALVYWRIVFAHRR